MNLVFCFLNRFYWNFLEKQQQQNHSDVGTLGSPEGAWKSGTTSGERSDLALTMKMCSGEIRFCGPSCVTDSV